MADLLEIRELGNRLLAKHGLGRVRFRFHTYDEGIGCCEYNPRTLEPETISLHKSMAEINSVYHCKQVLLHEIAHGHAGFLEDHGPKWMKIAADLGVVDPGPCLNATLLLPQGRWNAYCPGCSLDHPIHTAWTKPPLYAQGECVCEDHDQIVFWLPLGQTLRQEMQVRGLDKPRVNGAY